MAFNEKDLTISSQALLGATSKKKADQRPVVGGRTPSMLESLTPSQYAALFPHHKPAGSKVASLGGGISGGPGGVGGMPGEGGSGGPVGGGPGGGGGRIPGGGPSGREEPSGGGTPSKPGTPKTPLTDLIDQYNPPTKTSPTSPTLPGNVKSGTGYNPGLGALRQRQFGKEFSDDRVLRQFAALEKIEVGNPKQFDDAAKKSWFETVLNRAASVGRNTSATSRLHGIHRPYWGGGIGNPNSVSDAELAAFKERVNDVLSGRDGAKGATDNASAGTALRRMGKLQSEGRPQDGYWTGGAPGKGEYLYTDTPYVKRSNEYRKLANIEAQNLKTTESKLPSTNQKNSNLAVTWNDPLKSYTPESVKAMIKDGKKYFGVNFDYDNAKQAAKIIEAAGGEVISYTRGQEGGKEYPGETKQSPDAILADIRKKKKAYGVTKLELDNTDQLSKKNFEYILDEAKKDGVTLFPNNPHLNDHWNDYLEKHPGYADKMPTVIVENIGTLKPGTDEYKRLERFQKLAPNVQINGFEWKGNRPQGKAGEEYDKNIKHFTENFGPAQINKGKEHDNFVFDGNAQQIASKVGTKVPGAPAPVEVAAGEPQVVEPVQVAPKLPDGLNPHFYEYYDKLDDAAKERVRYSIDDAMKKRGHTVETVNDAATKHNEAVTQLAKAPIQPPSQYATGEMPKKPKEYSTEMLQAGNERLFNKSAILRAQGEAIDPKIVHTLKEASRDLPAGYRVEAVSGVRAGTHGSGNHHGLALDVQIYDDKGKYLPYDRYGPGWKTYEGLYRSAHIRAQELYPKEELLWGGPWRGGKAPPTGDPMHYQFRKRGIGSQGMKYTFEGGLLPGDPYKGRGGDMTAKERADWDARVRANVIAQKKQLEMEAIAKKEGPLKSAATPDAAPTPTATAPVAPTPTAAPPVPAAASATTPGTKQEPIPAPAAAPTAVAPAPAPTPAATPPSPAPEPSPARPAEDTPELAYGGEKQVSSKTAANLFSMPTDQQKSRYEPTSRTNPADLVDRRQPEPQPAPQPAPAPTQRQSAVPDNREHWQKMMHNIMTDSEKVYKTPSFHRAMAKTRFADAGDGGVGPFCRWGERNSNVKKDCL